jgi:hypothetical protein
MVAAEYPHAQEYSAGILLLFRRSRTQTHCLVLEQQGFYDA